MKRPAGSGLYLRMKLCAVARCAAAIACTVGVIASAAAKGKCEEWDCGENTPHVLTAYFWELDLDVAATDPTADVELLRFARTEAELDLGLVAPLDVQGSLLTTPGASVEGGVMEVRVGTKNYRIKIVDERSDQTFWTSEHAHLTTYILKYRDPTLSNVTWNDLCTPAAPGAGTWANLTAAIVFEGERYDPYARLVNPDPSPPGRNWFNIACAGSLPAKLFLLRRARAAGFAGDIPSLDERQAFANMLSANYCGDGEPFTVPGEPLRMRDDDLIADVPPVGFASFADVQTEAVWNQDGAVCLNTARREAEEPGITKHARSHCDAVGHPLPTCSELFGPEGPASWAEHGVVFSGSPLGKVLF